MKVPFFLIAASLLTAAPLARAADYTVTLAQVHLCCDSCVNDAKDAAATVPGASLAADKAGRTVTITATDEPTAQKAVDALVAAGYYGVPSDPAIHLPSSADVKPGAVTSLTLSNLHLCCKMCVSTFNKAVKKVQGVATTTAAKDADSVVITGSFNPQDVIAALNAAGFSAKVE